MYPCLFGSSCITFERVFEENECNFFAWIGSKTSCQIISGVFDQNCNAVFVRAPPSVVRKRGRWNWSRIYLVDKRREDAPKYYLTSHRNSSLSVEWVSSSTNNWEYGIYKVAPATQKIHWREKPLPTKINLQWHCSNRHVLISPWRDSNQSRNHHHHAEEQAS